MSDFMWPDFMNRKATSFTEAHKVQKLKGNDCKDKIFYTLKGIYNA